MRKTKLINKKKFKKTLKKCRICGETDYNVLDVHRIIPQTRYSTDNTVILCATDHRKVHAGEIIIDKYYMSTVGAEKLLRIIIDGEEKFV